MKTLLTIFVLIHTCWAMAQSGTKFIIEYDEQFDQLRCYEIDIKTGGQKYKAFNKMPVCRDQLKIKTKFELIYDDMFDENQCFEVNLETEKQKYKSFVKMENCKELILDDTSMNNDGRNFIYEIFDNAFEIQSEIPKVQTEA